MHLHAVILAGGRGERFWPLSRRERPKQFLSLIGNRSMLQSTFDRLAGWIPADRRWLVAGGPLIPRIREQVPDLREDRTIVEPVARNTAAAIGAAAAAIESTDPGAVMVVLPSDHWIPDAEVFREDVERAANLAIAVGGLNLFGIPITYPETGYGYLEVGAPVTGHPGIAKVAHFCEKPDRDLAVTYASRADMLWNSGIFVWRASAILAAIAEQMSGLRGAVGALRSALDGGMGFLPPEAQAALERYFREAPSESIDYAVLEKHEETYVSRARFRWSDVGTWLSWGERLEPDVSGNRGSGPAIVHDSRDCVYYAEGGLVALLGVRDLIVVRLKDVTLVCGRDSAQEVRRLVREAGNREDLEEFF
jgi:mannose-1-phosphate guanylyltransferase